MTTQTFSEDLHPRAQTGKFAAKPVTDAAGGMDTLGEGRSAVAFDFVGTDISGVRLLAGDTLRKDGAAWGATTWTIVEARGDKVTVASTENPKVRRHVDPGEYVVQRPAPGHAPDGNSASFHNVEAQEQLRDDWAGRDPGYAAQIQAVIDDLPMRKVGSSYRQQMIDQVPPELRRTIAESKNPPLYFSLRNGHNGWSHDDALTASDGHSTLPDRAPTDGQLRAMDDAELRTHQLVWRIRNDPATRELVNVIATERAAAAANT